MCLAFNPFSFVVYVVPQDFVGFLLGCSFSFETALQAAGLPIRHWEDGEHRTVPMYVTNIDTVGVPPFSGKLVVSMRPMPATRVKIAADVTAKYPRVHGA